MTLTNIQIVLVITTSTVAAVTGVLNIVWKFRDRRPNVRLHAGPKEFSIDQWSALYLVNHGTTPVRLADYGLVQSDGYLLSFPTEHEVGSDAPMYRSGEITVAPQGEFEAGADINGRLAGVFCRLYDDNRIRIAFYDSVPIKQRLFIRFKALLRI